MSKCKKCYWWSMESEICLLPLPDCVFYEDWDLLKEGNPFDPRLKEVSTK